MEFALIMIEILLEKVKAIKVTNISNTIETMKWLLPEEICKQNLPKK